MTINDNLRQVACLGAAGFIGTMLVLAVAAPVHAQAFTRPVTVTAHRDFLTERVPYGDLTLASKQGRSILYQRVGAAVNRVCPGVDAEGLTYNAQDCKDFAWEGARPQIRTAIKRAKSGASLAMAIEISTAMAK